MSWGLLAAAVTDHAPQPTPVQTRSLPLMMDQHVTWQETGTGPDHALSLPALFAVVRLIASTIDQLPLVNAPDWLARPRRYGAALDQGDLVQHTVAAMCLEGRAFWLARRVGESWQVNAVHNGSVGVDESAFGTVDLKFTYNGQPIDRVPAIAEQWRQGQDYLVHFPYMTAPGRHAGTSPVASAWETIAGYLAAERQAATLLDGGTISGGRLETDHEITAETAQRWRTQWIENRRQNVIPVLGNGLRYVNDIIEPDKAQFIQSRTYNSQTVAAMYGVPPDMLGMAMSGGGSSLSYSNSQDNNRRFASNCLKAFTTQIEDSINTLMPPGRGLGEADGVFFDYTDWEGSMSDADTAPVTD